MKHEFYLKRCLQLAELGKGNVSPNPMVGCVVVKNNKIIAEGYHEKFGEAHAEVNALKNLSPEDLIEATVYVSLEPCSHHGKTGPCCELLVAKGAQKVVIASEDPNPQVNGRGVSYLEKNNVEVISNQLTVAEQHLNRAFRLNQKLKRPYIIAKWAESKDGFIGKLNGEMIAISHESSKNFVHQLRHESDAILIGSATLKNDHPKLDCRYYSDKQLHKIVFTRNNNLQAEGFINLSPDNLIEQLQNLYKDQNIGQILIEGGAKTIEYFIKLNLIDEIIRIKSDTILSDGVLAPDITDLQANNHFELDKDKVSQYFISQ